MALVHGTRFVTHQRNGVRVLLNNWIPLGMAIQNSIANNTHSTLNAKLQGILKKLRSVQFLAACCLYHQVLDVVSCLSLRFEKGDVQAYEVMVAVEQTIQSATDLLEDDESSLVKAGYTVDANTISRTLPQPGHMKRNEGNREYTTVSLERMVLIAEGRRRRLPAGNMDENDEEEQDAPSRFIASIKERVILPLIRCLQQRFNAFNLSVYKHMLCKQVRYCVRVAGNRSCGTTFRYNAGSVWL